MASVCDRSWASSPIEATLKLKQAARWILPAAIGILAFLYCRAQMVALGSGPVASDFTWHWLAARAVLAGKSPYEVVVPGGPMQLNAGYLYPLPAAIVTIPFAIFLSPVMAASVFAGVSAALLTIGLLRTNAQRLPILGGVPFFWAVSSAQLSLISTAGALLPGLGWLSVLKPNIGLAFVAHRPTRSMVLGGALLTALAFIIQPDWLVRWLETIRDRNPGNYGMPLRFLGGPLLLLAITRWRRPEARLLLVMACIPQSLLFYDQLPLALVPRTKNEAMILVILSFAGYMVSSWMLPPSPTTAQVSVMYGPAIVLTLYLPCLIMVLRRPNVAETLEAPPAGEARGSQAA